MSKVEYRVHDGIAVIHLNNPPVNILSYELRRDIVNHIDLALSDQRVQAIVLAGNDRAFSGGADITEFATPMAYAHPNLPEVIEIIENSSKPVIAAISGACMGGGFELALGAHFRVARHDAAIALPEVKLGLIPGAGGTQRAPRILGLEMAVNLIAKGDPVSVTAFRDTALIDQYIDGDLIEAALKFANFIVAAGHPIRRISEMPVNHPQPEAFLHFARMTVSGTAGAFPAPPKGIDAIAAAVTKPFSQGLEIEAEIFADLLSTQESAALQHIFLAERAASKIADIPDGTPIRDVSKVGIIGAGTMGGGIAMAFLNAGIAVTVLEMKQEALDRGIGTIAKNYGATVSKGKLSKEKMDQRMGLLSQTLAYDSLSDCDLIIEAVYEDIGVKESVFRELDRVAKPGAILASNTSTLDLDKIASFTKRPEDVVGMHFFSPANVMKLLEVVRGKATGKEVMATAMAIAKRIRKTAVVSGVCDGFIGNRMLEHYGRVATLMLEQGATPWQIDSALEKWGMAMGIFKVFDLAGNDIPWAIRKRRYVERPEIQYSKIADLLCEQGHFGQKTGKGWYLYRSGNRNGIPDPEVEAMIEAFRKTKGIVPRKIPDREIVDKCVFALINEGARLLEERIAARSSDIDMVYLTGYGFPTHRGGPMHYANQIGLFQVVRRLKEFAETTGDDFWQPAALLKRLAAEGKPLN